MANPPFDAYYGPEPFIFVSCSHKDGSLVFPEISRLHQLGYRIWYDEGIDPGNEWTEEIARALEGATFFIVFISDAAVRSNKVRNEINFALTMGKPFLAIHLAEVKLPPDLVLRMAEMQAVHKWELLEEHYFAALEGSLPASTKGMTAGEEPLVIPDQSPLLAAKEVEVKGRKAAPVTTGIPRPVLLKRVELPQSDPPSARHSIMGWLTRSRLVLILGLFFLLLLLAGGGAAWLYLFGANRIAAEELVPGDTLFFATIPNAATIVAGYQTSQLKTLIDSPEAQPIRNAIVSWIGQKNLDLFSAFLPNLSGQSFIAITHFDPDNPGQTGFVAGMRPKAGLGDFKGFVEKVKAAWPDVIKQGTTGTGNVAGTDYQWIKGPGAADKICVAQVQGWIITTWGEAALQDWIERFEKQSATPSLAQNPDFQQSLGRLGQDPMAALYVNSHALLGIFQKQVQKNIPSQADYLAKKLGSIGGAAVASRFENGGIVDRFSLLMPHQEQLDSGVAGIPCPFETLNFTGPDTQLYWGSSIDWKQCYKNLQEQGNMMPPGAPGGASVTMLQTWAQGANLDVQHNIIDPLGSEFSLQVEWSADNAYPEAGLFVKLDKPDDFQPTIQAIIESVRKACETTAVIDELTAGDQKFAALKFVQASPITPVITENGPYLGVFLSENQAVRSFQRDPTITLVHNADFNGQVGDKRNGASQIFFLDTPHLLDHAYRTALPYASLASMFNQSIAAILKGKSLPSDLSWLAPIGTWSLVVTPQDDSIEGYSVSGIGNQGIPLGVSLAGTGFVLQSMGLIPKLNQASATPSLPVSPAPPPAPAPASSPAPPAATSPASPPAAAESSTATNAPPAATDSTTNVPSSTPDTGKSH